MSVLTLTFQDGTSSVFPFHTGSQLSVTTPDGVNGDRYGSWGEITGLTLGDPVEPDVKFAVTFAGDATPPAFFAGLKSQVIDPKADDTDGVSTYSAIALLEEQPKSEPTGSATANDAPAA